MFFENEKIAREACGYNETIIPVDGGFSVVEWDEYNRRLSEEAYSLANGGWMPDDESQMAEEYEMPLWYAREVCAEIASLREGWGYPD